MSTRAFILGLALAVIVSGCDGPNALPPSMPEPPTQQVPPVVGDWRLDGTADDLLEIHATGRFAELSLMPSVIAGSSSFLTFGAWSFSAPTLILTDDTTGSGHSFLVSVQADGGLLLTGDRVLSFHPEQVDAGSD